MLINTISLQEAKSSSEIENIFTTDDELYKAISTKSDGHIYHTKKNALMGRNVSDVVEYLKNPLNEDILDDLTKSCEQYWKS